jgi:hypothetical protein
MYTKNYPNWTEPQILIPECFDGAVVGFKRVVEGGFFLGQTQVFTTVAGLPHFFCQREQSVRVDEVTDTREFGDRGTPALIGINKPTMTTGARPILF